MYTLNSKVRYSECSENRILNFASLMKYLTDCCVFQSDSIGFDLDRLEDLHQGWYVVSWQILLDRLPHEGENIMVHTMPTKVAGMMGYRDYLIETEDHERLAAVTSTWVYMDLAADKPVRVSQEMVDGFGRDLALDIEWKDRKITLPEDYESQLADCDFSFQVRNMHLDSNHHMNNAQYIQAAMELVDETSITYVRAEYKQVAYLGDIIKVKSFVGKESTYILLYNDDTDKTYAIVEVFND